MCKSQKQPMIQPQANLIDGSSRPTPAKLLLLHGPNLNMLGRRDKNHYGSFTLEDVEQHLISQAQECGYELEAFQSNHEGFLIDKIHASMDSLAGILLNAGALTHYSYALRDAIELCPVPVVEVHISDIATRESLRRISVLEEVCLTQVAGYGFDSYRIALEKLIAYLAKNKEARPD